MKQPNTPRYAGATLVLGACLALVTVASAGCLKIGGNEPLLKIENPNPPPQRVDTSRVQVNNLEDARQQLAQAYVRNDYLEQQNARLQRDKDQLKADLKQARSERNMYKNRYEKAIGKD